jgi:hypothetical protein
VSATRLVNTLDLWIFSTAQTLFYNHSVTTTPPVRIGTPGRNVEMIFDEGYIVLYASSTEENFDQILELPCSIINHILLQPSPKTSVSQQIFEVAIEIQDTPAQPCLLNSKVIVLTRLCMTLAQDLEIFVHEVRQQCQKATFKDIRPRASTSQDFVEVQAPLDPWDSEEEYFGSDEQPRDTVELERQDDNAKSLELGIESNSGSVEGYSDEHGEGPNLDVAYNALSQGDGQQSPKVDLQDADIEEISGNQVSEALSGNVESALLGVRDTIKPMSEAASDGITSDNHGDWATSECHQSTSENNSSSPLNESGTKRISGPQKPSMSKSQSKRPRVREEASISEKTKKYSLRAKPPLGSAAHMASSKANERKTQPNDSKEKGDIFDFSDDEESEAGPVKKGKPAKKTKTKGNGPQTKGKTNGKNGIGKPKVDHSKSAIIEQVIPTRSSERAAATKAKLNMRKLNSVDEEELSDERESGPSQPNVSRKRKAVAEAISTDGQEVDIAAAISDPIDVQQNEQLVSVEQHDEEASISVDSNSVPVAGIDQNDIHDNKLPNPKSEPESEPKLQPRGSQESQTNKRSHKSAAFNFADKMADILESEGDGFQMFRTENEALLEDSEIQTNRLPTPPRPPKIKAKLTLQNLPQVDGPSSIADAKRPGSFTEIDAEEAVPLNEQQKRLEEETQGAYKLDIQENVDQSKKPSEEAASPMKKTAEEGKQVEPPTRKLDGDGGRTNRNRAMETIDKDKDVKADLLPITPGAKEPEQSAIVTPRRPGHPRVAREFKVTPIINAVALNDGDRGHKYREDPAVSSYESVSDEKKRKADRSTGAPSKRIRPNMSLQSNDPIVAQRSLLGEVQNSLVQPENKGNALLDESTIRKPHLIHFDKTGARNQGLSVVSKRYTTPQPDSRYREENTEKSRADKGSENKRRRRFDHDQEEDGPFPSESPPRKRQSVSPVRVVDSRSPDVKSSSPPAPSSKCSSQAPKVDEFGSPIAHKLTDRILNIQERLQESAASGLKETSVPAAAPADSSDQSTPEVFGQRLKLASITKARPDPPGDLPVRYIPHTKTQYGYEGILTMESVQEEKTLPDPFVEKLAHNSSHFTERLRAGTSADKKGLKSGKKGSSTSKSGIVDPERTLVAFSSPSAATTTSSSSSASQSASRTPMERDSGRQWELAVRPHYQDYADVVHHIADEMVIRLANEEDASMLIVQQYDDNGARIIDGLAKGRDEEKARIQQALNRRTNDMAKMCSEASEFMREVQESLKSSPAEDYEQAWRKRQEAIQKRITAGRYAAE